MSRRTDEEPEHLCYEALNCMLDYIETAEKRGDYMGHGRRIMARLATVVRAYPERLYYTRLADAVDKFLASGR